MKKINVLLIIISISMAWSVNVMGFDVTTYAKVVSIDEVDVMYTRVGISKATSCGATWFWMARSMTDYNLYMARVLTALVSDRTIVINERNPAWCGDVHLYNPRIGIQ